MVQVASWAAHESTGRDLQQHAPPSVVIPEHAQGSQGVLSGSLIICQCSTSAALMQHVADTGWKREH